MCLHEGISSSWVSSREYFCVFVLVRGFLRRQMHEIPQKHADIQRKPRNTPMTTYKIDQSEINGCRFAKKCITN